MYYKCVVLLFFINYLRLTSYLPKTYIRPSFTSLLTAIFIILSTWLYNISSNDILPSTLLSNQSPSGLII